MNLVQLRTRLQELGYGTDSVSAQNEALRGAYRTVTGLRRWPWLESDTTILTIQAGYENVELLTVPDLMWVDAVRIESATSEYLDLEYIEPLEFRALSHVDRATGVPSYWTEVTGELRFF